MLTWGLVVATYDRADILPLCVQLALDQSRPPTQVVVVDASDDWLLTRSTVEDLVATSGTVALTYVAAEERSASQQRNQGLRLLETDVAFLLDDDSLMHPGCAAEVMAVYDADTDGRVVGVQTGDDPLPPISVEAFGPAKETGTLRARSGRIGRLQRWVEKHALLMDAESRFIPYDGRYPDHPAPPAVEALGAQRTRLFLGRRMTFRTAAVKDEPFEPALRSYSPGEDADASYRISRLGAMVTAPGARLHHHQSAAGRIDRRRTELLFVLNQAFFLRRHAADLRSARRAYFRLTARRLLAEVGKDLGSRRWDLPQVRGVLRAIRLARQVFERPTAGLADWYVDVQLRILTPPGPAPCS